MPRAMRLLSGFVTAPDTTLTTLTMGSGDSATIQPVQGNSRVCLLNMWADWQTAGILRITSTKLHDAVQGIRSAGTASEVIPLLPWETKQELYPQDALTIQLSGSATAGDIESASLLVYYEDLPGAAQMLWTPQQVEGRKLNTLNTQHTLALGTAGGYSGEAALSAGTETMKANTWYALLGYTVTVECCSIGIRSTETANLRVGGPGHEQRKDITNEWFVNLSRYFNMPMIPLFNSANKANILLDGVQDENGADTILTLNFVELSGI